MSERKPIISIVIPTYEMKGQGVEFLERCLRSIEKQIGVTPNSVEIVISDQSHDDAIEVFCQERVAHNIIPIRYQRTKTGKGSAAHNLNQGINLAQAQYIKILFQDDLLVETTYLKTLLELILEKAPDCIFSAATHTRDGQEFYSPITPTTNPYFLFGNNTVSSPSVITARKALLISIPFDEHLKLLFDCDFYYAIFSSAQRVEFCNLITVANGVWDGQTQFGISAKQFTQEVRYLHWKYPSAQLDQLLPSYQNYFSALHPDSPFPFSTDIKPALYQSLWWQLTRRQS